MTAFRAGIIAAAAGLLVAAARGDLWLDEIWSLSLAQAAESAGDVFTRLRHDNNHPLNTLYLILLGPGQPSFCYRIPAVLAGIGSLLLLGRIAGRWGRLEELAVLFMAGTSFPLLLYWSEARGYALAIFWSLAAYRLLAAWHRDGRHWWLPLLWSASVLGTLSHLSFIIVLLSLAAFSLAQELTSTAPGWRKVGRLAAAQLPPLAFFTWFYLFFARDMTLGGGPVYAYWDVLCRAAAMLTGAPDTGWPRVLAAIGSGLVLVSGIGVMIRHRDDHWPLYLAVLLVVPALMLWSTRPRFLYFRFFILCFPFFYLLLSYLLGRAQRRLRGRWRWAIALLPALMLIGQMSRVVPLLVHGRGGYSRAVAAMAARTERSPITVASDHDFRNGKLLRFYADRLAASKTFRYVGRDARRRVRPDWFIAHSQDAETEPPAELVVGGAGAYELVGTYRSGPVSGWDWYLYRRRAARCDPDFPDQPHGSGRSWCD